ncbi:large subunit ribosomal protein L10 [Methanomicrobium sp. W14]|jgi:large subunit ribosomal protein L10|uniref:50S ribosomal protein L10 n=1 Tax=Methanomicrobium sp. W14 TaxID=2817839 RepID=UPI001AE152F4|nr:50S ribosomal protein L10 [Methanomicrobium sp. W14]MBP2133035.1 large subunit ribosomal protein L10 [Methanomicrobium sp. W14]
MVLYTHHLPQWKRDEVEEIIRFSKEYKLTGLVDLHGIPASQLQQMRRNLRGLAVLKMTRNTLIEHAFSELGGEIGKTAGYIDGQSAMIYTNENPFKLYRKLQDTMTKMVAKPGDTAPEDVVISKGPTAFPPGPIVGTLQQAGIPAAIESGKVVIRETKTVVKAGEEINEKMADVLSKLDIRPIDVGLSLQIAFYDGTFFEPGTLAIDETEYFNNIILAAQQAFNLSVNAAYPTATTAGAIIGKAVREAKNLAVEAAIYEKDVVELIIGRAQRESLAVKSLVE